MQKIITNYEITETNDPNEIKYQETESIIKIPIFKNEDKKIEIFEKKSSNDLTEDLEEEEEIVIVEEPPLPPEPIDPKLQLIRNHDGIVVGIEVFCGCGRYTLIKMEY